MAAGAMHLAVAALYEHPTHAGVQETALLMLRNLAINLTYTEDVSEAGGKYTYTKKQNNWMTWDDFCFLQSVNLLSKLMHIALSGWAELQQV